MKTPEEILAKFNITAETKHHSYDYLYNSFVLILHAEPSDKRLIHQLFIGKVADEIGQVRTMELLKEAHDAFKS